MSAFAELTPKQAIEIIYFEQEIRALIQILTAQLLQESGLTTSTCVIREVYISTLLYLSNNHDLDIHGLTVETATILDQSDEVTAIVTQLKANTIKHWTATTRGRPTFKIGLSVFEDRINTIFALILRDVSRLTL